MDYSRYEKQGGDTVVYGVRNFDIDQILDCGQSFRWERVGQRCYSGVAFGRELTLRQEDDRLTLFATTPQEFREVWHHYFDFDRDYSALKERFSRSAPMRAALAYCPGMRVVRQDGWEALVSFIISQNNNVPRIKGIVARLCESFGARLPGGGYAFPTPQALAERSPEDFSEIRAGFRAKYISSAAELVSGGRIDLSKLNESPLDEARAALMQIRGVGPKVAECALLYGFARCECFPVDVWIARALEELYPRGFPEELGPWAGIAQQYLFHYMRTSREEETSSCSSVNKPD